MGQIFRIREMERDSELALIKKEISSHRGNFSFESPVVSQKYATQFASSQSIEVNEIIRHIDNNTIKELDNSITPFATSVRNEFLQDKLNITIFNFKFNSIPDEADLRLLSHALHSSSDSTMFLPTVKCGLLQENEKYSERKIQEYIGMMRAIIRETEAIGNGKEFVGTIPLIAPKFVRPIIQFYLAEGLRAFIIDANTKDVMLNEGDFRVILSEINTPHQLLGQSLVFACNLGSPQFVKDEIRSDDFLSVFAYVDVLGSTFKTRGGKGMSGIPRAKVFSRDRYAYEICSYPDASKMLGRPMTYPSLKNYNRAEQLKESLKIRNLVGIEKMTKYLGTKGAVDPTSMKHLESIATKVKV